MEDTLQECEHCKGRKDSIAGVIEDLIYNKFIEKQFLLELDSILAENSINFNISQIDFGYEIEDCLYYLNKEIEERRGVYEYDLYSKSKTKEIGDSLYYLFNKLSLDFFVEFKIILKIESTQIFFQ